LLPRTHRLRDTRSFRAVYGRGRSWATPLVALHALAVEGDRLLVGITAGKKVGKAVERNRVRRRLREAVRRRLPEMKRGYQVVLVARGASREAPLTALQATVDTLLQRAGLWQEGGAQRTAHSAQPEQREAPTRARDS
jgi:ribonuclease P protein component